MIIIRITGGLGNQLFQYALYRKLQSMGKEVYIDLDYYKLDKNRNYELETIGLHPIEAKKQDVIKLTGGEKSLSKLTRRLGLKKTYFKEKNLEYDSNVLKKENTYLNGYWQSEKYFKDLRESIVNEVRFPTLMSEKNQKMFNKIRNSDSVCITIRRGDYLSNDKVRRKYFVCDEKYFEIGMKKIAKKIEKPVYFVFSDDIEWVKKNFLFQNEVYFESGEDPTCEVLKMMSSCKHFIISNSTLSWWAQYLSDNSEKIVYAPHSWYADGRKTDIYQDNWNFI